jgi:hypothetical protein
VHAERRGDRSVAQAVEERPARAERDRELSGGVQALAGTTSRDERGRNEAPRARAEHEEREGEAQAQRGVADRAPEQALPHELVRGGREGADEGERVRDPDGRALALVVGRCARRARHGAGPG